MTTLQSSLVALAGALLFTSAHAATYTVGKTDSVHPSGWAWYIGQTFTPEIQGPQGTGFLPDVETVDLVSFKVFPWEASANPPGAMPSMAYIYDAFDLPDTSDDIGAGPVLGTGTHSGDGLYDFGTVELEVDGFYLFILEDAASIRYWQSSDYPGGEAYWTDASTVGANLEIKEFETDVDFIATFDVIPEPSTLSLLAVAGGVLVLALRRRR